MTRTRKLIYLGSISGLLLLALAWYVLAYAMRPQTASTKFDGERAYADVKTQVSFGPRIPGTPAHARTVAWISTQLEAAGWHVEIQQSTSMGHPIQNILAYRVDAVPQILLGAHYDSRIYASRDPDPAKQTQPVPGADDGASGVAVLLELARTLPSNTVPVSLAFFDAEDNGQIPGWDWLLGSKAFVSGMRTRPDQMILLDMVGGPNLSIPMEGYSDPALRASLWEMAARLGYGSIFLPQVKYNIEDDHLPFLGAGIPAADIIDLDYAYWHTVSDTPEHVVPRSLQVVGDVVSTWIAQQKPRTTPTPSPTP
ncbi:MAG TPA: M28 family peptidase [Anaerolineales bacterium]